MSTTIPELDTPAPRPDKPRPHRRQRGRSSLTSQGEPMVWLTGGALALCVAMIVGLLAYVLFQGTITFWPGQVVRVTMIDGAVFMGEVTRTESYRLTESTLGQLSPEAATLAKAAADSHNDVTRRLLWTANYDLTGSRFTWVSNFAVTEETTPDWAMIVERTENGRFNGIPQSFLVADKPTATKPQEIWNEYEKHRDAVQQRRAKAQDLERQALGEINSEIEAARHAMRAVALEHGTESAAHAEAEKHLEQVRTQANQEAAKIQSEINELREENEKYQILFRTADGQEKQLALADIVRMIPANQLDWTGRLGVYLSRWWEFLFDEPREANMEGGVWPSIVGTLTMTLLMAVAVVPFGVLAALYLREYAKAGPMISAVRVAINNLAGVPSIVFGVFGLGFFCYMVGASIDQVFFPVQVADGNPVYGKGALVWAALTLALLTLPVVIVASEEAFAAVPNSMREGSYGCGASRWQTIRRIVLPHAMPGIMTGTILAMARGAGEVAPLMLVGAVKLAPELPIDMSFPFVHPDRSFMHLGFHIYDLSSQSPDSEAAKPMVFTTTLLLISLVAALNLSAVWLRTRLRARFSSGHF